MKNHLSKVVVCGVAALMCYASSALATVGNPDESLLRNQQVQDQIKDNKGNHQANAQKAQAGWNKLTPEQQANAKAKEKARLQTIGSNHKAEIQDDQGQS